MTESSWWSTKIRPRLLRRPDTTCWKVQDAINKGLPDVWIGTNTKSAWLELKYRTAWPARADTLVTFSRDKEKHGCIVSPEQLRHLTMVRHARCQAYVLIGVGAEWLLLAPEDLENRGMTEVSLRLASLLQGTSASFDSLLDYINRN